MWLPALDARLPDVRVLLRSGRALLQYAICRGVIYGCATPVNGVRALATQFNTRTGTYVSMAALVIIHHATHLQHEQRRLLPVSSMCGCMFTPAKQQPYRGHTRVASIVGSVCRGVDIRFVVQH